MVFHRDTPFLRPAIRSVLTQTWPDLELVLVDNGTGLNHDALGDLGRDARLRWVRLARNEGIAVGHNAGVAAAQGEFLGLLDYDDIALPTRCERQIARLRAEPALGLISSLAESIDEHGAVQGREFALVAAEAQRAYSAFAAPVVTPAYLGRREVFTRFPYRTELNPSADFDFLARALEAYPAAAVPEVLLHYRRHAMQTTVAQSGLLEAQRCAIRTLTARRRAGRPEAFAPTLAAIEPALAAAESCRRWAARNLAENLPVLAAYHARRSIGLQRTARAIVRGTALGLAAWRGAAAGERGLARRHFFKGPVRALGLRPA